MIEVFIAATGLLLTFITGVWHVSSSITKVSASQTLLQKMLEGNTTMTHSTLEKVADISERVAKLEGKVGSGDRYPNAYRSRQDTR